MSAQSVEGETDSGQDRPSTPLTGGPSAHYRLVLTLVVVGLIAAVVRVFFVQTFVIPSPSMQPGLQVGDRVVVSRLDYRFGEIRRGDVVVFDGEGVFTQASPARSPLAEAGRAAAQALGAPVGDSDFVKRVIGVGGDHVVCCDDQDRISVNGRAFDEPYVYPGDDPSDVEFDETVPPGHLWVMGDHRSLSADSRAHLGDPGGGMVPVERVVGRVVAVWWPWSRATGVGRIAANDVLTPTQGTGAAQTAPADRAASPGREGTP